MAEAPDAESGAFLWIHQESTGTRDSDPFERRSCPFEHSYVL